MKRVIIFFADGFEEIEAISVVDILRRANVLVDMCSITGNESVIGSHQISLKCDLSINDVIVSDYDACVLPGGMPGADTLSKNQQVKNIFVEMNKAGKLCCAICAAPMALYKFGLLSGKTCVSYPGFLEYEDVIKGAGKAAKDGNIITATGPAAATEFAFEILKALGYIDEANKIYKGMLFD